MNNKLYRILIRELINLKGIRATNHNSQVGCICRSQHVLSMFLPATNSKWYLAQDTKFVACQLRALRKWLVNKRYVAGTQLADGLQCIRGLPR